MLPSTITIAGLNTQAGFAQYPASLVFTKVSTEGGQALYTSDSIPLTVGGAARTVLGRNAVITFAHKGIGTKSDPGTTTLARCVLPQQGNELAADISEVQDGKLTVLQTLPRSNAAVPTGSAAAYKAVRTGVFTDAILTDLALGNL